MADGMTKDGLTGLVMADAVAATCVSAGDAPMPSYVAATEAVGSGRAAVRQMNILVMPHDDVVPLMMTPGDLVVPLMMSPGVVTRAGVMSSVMIMAMGLKEEIVIEQSRVEPWIVVVAHVETRGILRPQRVDLRG